MRLMPHKLIDPDEFAGTTRGCGCNRPGACGGAAPRSSLRPLFAAAAGTCDGFFCLAWEEQVVTGRCYAARYKLQRLTAGKDFENGLGRAGRLCGFRGEYAVLVHFSIQRHSRPAEFFRSFAFVPLCASQGCDELLPFIAIRSGGAFQPFPELLRQVRKADLSP